MYQAVEILVPIGAFAMVFGIVYVVITANHRKEVAMIEAGMNPNENKQKSYSKLRKALLYFLVPTGILIGILLSTLTTVIDRSSMGLLFAFLFGGLALLISHIIESKKGSEID